MAGSSGFALSRRTHEQVQFYNPPAMRKHQQMTLHHPQQQIQGVAKSDSAQVPQLDEESEDSVTAVHSQPPSVGAGSPLSPPPSNLDSFLESVTPSIAARHFSEVMKSREAETRSFYLLGDLWDSFSEWSLYGVGVPLLLNGGEDTIKQYYVPFLSGIQLYVDPSKPRPLFRSSQDGDAEWSMETSVGGGCDYVSDKSLKSLVDGLPNQHRLVRNSQQPNRHLRTEKSPASSSGDEAEIDNSPGQLLFEYLEPVQPHNRSPLIDKISVLASQFPELRKCRSCDLLPSSWISVAWYPIYRIPMGSTLRDLDASFLTFHYLSTHPRCTSRIQFSSVNSRKGLGSVDTASKILLPVFGLATYKLKGSLLTPCGPHENEQEKSLLEAADTWLKGLQVVLPDYQFFRANYSQWR